MQERNQNGYEKKALSFAVGVPRVDYLRLTSWDYEAFKYLFAVFNDRLAVTGKEAKEAKIQQYAGDKAPMYGGWAFCGVGAQRNKEHYRFDYSGECGHYMLDHYQHCIQQGWNIACTRIDPQITVERPNWFDPRSLFDHVDANTRYSPGWRESLDEYGHRLRTVYIGSRLSDWFIRTYEKPTKGNVYLRFEMEIKGQVARVMGARIAQERRMIGEYLLGRLHKINHPGLTSLYIVPLDAYEGDTVRIERVFEEDKTRSWLLGSVLPAFTRYINSDSGDIEVLERFATAIHYALNPEKDDS